MVFFLLEAIIHPVLAEFSLTDSTWVITVNHCEKTSGIEIGHVITQSIHGVPPLKVVETSAMV